MKKQLENDLTAFVHTEVNMSKAFHDDGDLIDLSDDAKDEACEIFLRNHTSWMPDIMPPCVDSYEAALDAIYSDKPNEFYYLLHDIHRQAVACGKKLHTEEMWDFGELFFDVADAVASAHDTGFDYKLRDAIYLYLESTLREKVDEVWGYYYGERDEYGRYA